MKFQPPLQTGILVKRYKRFLADVKFDGQKAETLVHVPNSGSMLGVKEPGSRVWVSTSDNPKRKIPYTLQMVQPPNDTYVGVNTILANNLVQEAFENREIPSWKSFEGFKREVKVSDESRIDFVFFNKDGKKHFVEVKNVSMAKPPWAVFPDAVTTRGQKHLKELMTLIDQGHAAELFFVVQRDDCNDFRPCDEIDPAYGMLLRRAFEHGVKIQAWACEISPASIRIYRQLNIDLSSVTT